MVFATTNQRDFAVGPEFVPLPYCLVDSIDWANFAGHQKFGVMYQVDSCDAPLEYSTDCVTGTGIGPAKQATASVLWRASDPFLVYSWLPCTFAGGEPPEKLRQDTLAAHQNNVKRRVGEIFWSGGSFSNSQRLAANTEIVIPAAESPAGTDVILQTAATIVSGGGVLDVVTAVGQLEQNMANCYGGVPYLHVPHGFIAELAANHLIRDERDERGRLRTPAGSVVVGYAGSNLPGPDGTSAGANQAWIYATGAPKGWRGSLNWIAKTPQEMLVKATNGTVLIVEERFIVGWDCCHFAALVSTV